MIANAMAAAISALVVMIGWVVVHRSNLRRDTLVKRRDLRVQYLLDAYRRLENASGRSLEDMPVAKRAFESAVADIQLLGTRSQIEALLAYLNQHVRDGGGNVDPLLKLIRDDLRRELNLEEDVPLIHQFRFKGEQ